MRGEGWEEKISLMGGGEVGTMEMGEISRDRGRAREK